MLNSTFHFWDIILGKPKVIKYYVVVWNMFILTPTGRNDPILLIFFEWVETTNLYTMCES